MTSRTKVTGNYRVTIPKKIRKKIGVEAGDELEVTYQGELIILKKVGVAKVL